MTEKQRRLLTDLWAESEEWHRRADQLEARESVASAMRARIRRGAARARERGMAIGDRYERIAREVGEYHDGTIPAAMPREITDRP